MHSDPILDQAIRKVPNFPHEGILFYDITGVLTSPPAFAHVIDTLKRAYEGKGIGAVAAVESRGFVFAAPLALHLGVPLILVRKKGKLPGKTLQRAYSLEYGQAVLEVHPHDVPTGVDIVIVDDLLATGGTLRAAAELLEEAGGKVTDLFCVVGLPFLSPERALGGRKVVTMIDYASELACLTKKTDRSYFPPMKKGELTRQRVLHDVGGLLNRTGYLPTPLSSILDTVGLQKGGLYNHFESKDSLALEAFRENLARLGEHLRAVAQSSDDPKAVLDRLLEASVDVAAGSVVPGGCPVLNAGTESDDLSEPLRAEAARGWDGLKSLFLAPLRQLASSGRLKEQDPERTATFLTAVVEGGILSAKVTGRPDEQRAVLETARQFLAVLTTKEEA